MFKRTSARLLVTVFSSVCVATACGSGDDGGHGASGGGLLVAGSSQGGTSSGVGGQGGSPSAGVSDGAGTGGDGAAVGGTTAEPTEGDAGAAIVEPKQREYPDVEFVYEPETQEDPLTPEEACALGSSKAVPAPLDMYVLFDRSGSMNLPQAMPTDASTPGEGDCNVGDPTVSRWCYSINALDQFFGSSVAAGSGVALQFFPAGGCTSSSNPFLYACCSSGNCCRGGAEATPDVPLGDLPAHRGELVKALNAQIPWADRTPIEAALRGMIDYTAKARRPGRQMIGLLITDGGPEGCQSSAATLAQLVKDHRARTGIPIYVVGTQGAAFSWLETIAIAGGAPEHSSYCAGGVRPCHFYSVGSGSPDVFIEVLRQIQRSAIACQFAMPTSETGLVDPKEVALSFTPSGTKKAVRLNRVGGASACSTAGGFYYDDPKNPKQIRLCPSSCEAFRAGDGGKVDVLLGCQGS